MGRTNVGNSRLLNLMLGQDIDITSPIAGTTTDIVENAIGYCRSGLFCFSIQQVWTMFQSYPVSD